MSETTNLAVTKIEDISPVKKKMTFEIPWDDTKKELEAVFRKVGKTAKIKGFRPGHVPKPVLEAYYKEYAEEEAINNLVNRFYWNALEEHKITPLSRPEIDQQGIVKDSPFSFSATLEVEPVLDAQQYTGLQLEKEQRDVTDIEIELRLHQLQEMYSTMEEVTEDRAVKEGDFVTIDFQGFVDGQPGKNMQSNDYLLEIGSKSFIPGFEEQVVGMKAKEEKDLNVTFPEDYGQKDLGGKEVVFKVTLKGIKEKKRPALDEEFVKNFEQYEKFEDLKADIVKSIEEQHAEQANNNLRTSIIDKLLENNPFEVPESLVERQIYYMMADTHRRMSMQGMEPKAAAELLSKMRDMYKEEAAKVVKTFLLVKNIAAKESIAVTDEEIKEYVEKIAQQRAQDYEAAREALEKDGVLEQIEGDLLHKKVFEFLESKAEITVVKKTEEKAEEAK